MRPPSMRSCRYPTLATTTFPIVTASISNRMPIQNLRSPSVRNNGPGRVSGNNRRIGTARMRVATRTVVVRSATGIDLRRGATRA